MAVDRSLSNVNVGDDQVRMHVRRHGQARRMILRIDRLSGDVKVTVPPRVSQKAIRRFVEQHLDWIEQERANLNAPIVASNGVNIPFLGVDHRLVFTDKSPRRVVVDDEQIIVGGPADQAPARLERWLRAEAKKRLAIDVQDYAAQLRVSYQRLSIGDMKTRWGSCSSKGTLKFNWRLVLAPPNVRRYVAAHEVAHLLEMNHSDRFWQHVASCMADFAARRRWLKAQGGELMELQFKSLNHQTGG